MGDRNGPEIRSIARREIAADRPLNEPVQSERRREGPQAEGRVRRDDCGNENRVSRQGRQHTR